MIVHIRKLKPCSNLIVSWMVKSCIPTQVRTLYLHFYETRYFLALFRDVCATYLFLRALNILYYNNIIV